MKTINCSTLVVLVILVWGGLVACGGGGGDSDGNWCPGVICNNCARDCLDVELNCGAGQSEACVGGSYFDADENLRCVFCVND